MGNQEEALSEQYDYAQTQIASVQAQLAKAQATLAGAVRTTNVAKAALKADAIQAYLNGGSNPLTSTSSLSSATENMLANEYVNTLVTTQSDDLDQYRTASLQEQSAANALKKEQGVAQAKAAQLASDRSQVQSLDNQVSAQYSQVTGQIRTLIQQQEIAAQQAAAAALRAQQQAAAAQAAALAAANQSSSSSSSSSGSTGTTVNYTPPAPGSGASGAVAAAESRVGDWYQWGAAGPNTFDCSGLVMWAYAQVGISLPHYSGAQYADTTHIPMSDLQPGDLVFFSNPGQHVAIYVGGGDIVEAAHTGTQVHVVPMYSGFTLAGRVG